jgi:hypothetical protein
VSTSSVGSEEKSLAKAVTKGDVQELRLGRILFAEGSFVRRAIDLNLALGEGSTITDLDIWAMRFAPDLSAHLSIGECKSAEGKKGPKVADRLLWVRGLADLVRADHAFVATAKSTSDRVRHLAKELGVSTVDERDLAHRESILGLDGASHWGPYAPELLTRQREIYDQLKTDEDLKRVYWFVRSEFWLATPTIGLKRTLGALRVVRDRGTGKEDQPEREALLWLGRQCQVNLVLVLTRLAGAFYRHAPGSVRDRLLEELAAGPGVDYRTLREWSRNADRYVETLLQRAGVDPAVRGEAVGGLAPTPPSYAEPLLEVLERLAAAPWAVQDLARVADWNAAAVELGEELGQLPGPAIDLDEIGRLLRLVAAFLGGQIKLPEELMQGLLIRELPAPSTREDEAAGSKAEEPSSGTDTDVDSKSTLFDATAGTASNR